MLLHCDLKFGYNGSFEDNLGLLALKRTNYSSTDILKGRVHDIQDVYRDVQKVEQNDILGIEKNSVCF